MKYVKVRIACAVGSNGKWSAFGPCEDPTLCSDGLCEYEGKEIKYPEQEKLYWILAELPIPEATEVQGIVA